MHSQAQHVAPLSRGDLAVALLPTATSLLLYYRTYVRWVLPADSGEFQVLAHEVGAAHTTGYPVYLLLAKLFILLVPAPSIAAGVNLFSAFMAALTVGLVYLAGRLLTGHRWLPLFGAAALAVGYAFWSQALIAEVYSTGAAFLAAICVFIFQWYETGKAWPLVAAGIVGGLGIGVHASVPMLAPAVVVLLALTWHSKRQWLKPALLGGSLGLALYFAAFLAVDLHAAPANIFNAAYSPARSNWDLTAADLASPFSRIFFLMTATQWRSAMFAEPLFDTPIRLGEYLLNLPRELSLLTQGLAVLGLAGLFRRDRRLGWFFAVALLVHWACYFNYRVGDLYVFYIPGYVMLAMLATVGLAVTGGALRRLPPVRIGRSQPLLHAGVLGVVALLAVGPVLRPYVPAVLAGRVPFLGKNGYLVDGNTERVESVARATVERLESNAIVFTDWYWLYPYYYAAHIELGRTGMQFIETHSRSDKAGLATSIVQFVQANYPDRPIYFSERVSELEDAGFRFRDAGIGEAGLYKLEYPH